MPTTASKPKKRVKKGKKKPKEDPFAGVRELEKKIQLLRWRKIENETAIRTALAESKDALEEDAAAYSSLDGGSEKAEWVETVIKEELDRPLELTFDQIRRLEIEDERERNRVKTEVSRNRANIVKGIERAKKSSKSGPFPEPEKAIATMKGLLEEEVKGRQKARLKELTVSDVIASRTPGSK